MSSTAETRARFLDLHKPGSPLVMPNPWDTGTAKLFASLGFEALATTSSGHAATLGRFDGEVSRDEALAHADEIAAATPLPVNADLENGFADDPEGVAETVRLAAATGMAGCSIEDWSGTELYGADEARDRVAAAAEAAHAEGAGLVLTARAEGHLRGRPDLAESIARLQSYEAVGADVVYAPGLVNLDHIGRVVEAVGVPVNVLTMPGGPTISELASVGVARISVGGALNLVALGAITEAARELQAGGPVTFWEAAKTGSKARNAAFGPAS